jgi:hypothetical protein
MSRKQTANEKDRNHRSAPLISEKPQLNRCLQRLHDKAGQTQTGDDKKQLSSRHSQVSFAG